MRGTPGVLTGRWFIPQDVVKSTSPLFALLFRVRCLARHGQRLLYEISINRKVIGYGAPCLPENNRNMLGPCGGTNLLGVGHFSLLGAHQRGTHLPS